MYFLAVRGTSTRASRGYPEVVNTDSPNYAAMKEFCERYSIQWQEPQWHIFSLWG
jgi:hypothetical protein